MIDLPPASQQISIVTVLHNSAAVIGACLASIPKGVVVYVVDNASDDDGVALAKKLRPDVIVIRSDKNIGFGRANNLALERVTTEFAFILNPDTVLNTSTLDKLLISMQKYKNAAIVAPTIYYQNGDVQQSFRQSLFKDNNSQDSHRVPDGDSCVEWLLGAALLLRMSAFTHTGFFDPNIFLFYEDDDLCMRMKEAGYNLIITPDTDMMHLYQQSSPKSLATTYRKSWHMCWSRLYLEGKYKGVLSANVLADSDKRKAVKQLIIGLVTLKRKMVISAIAEMRAGRAFLQGKGAF